MPWLGLFQETSEKLDSAPHEAEARRIFTLTR
jgi:hypothetical protein